MKTIQSTEWVEPIIRQKFEKNPRRSVSALFRYYRKLANLSLVGDYPLLHCIFSVAVSVGVSLSRSQVIYALNKSDELRHVEKKTKGILADQLCNIQHVQSYKYIHQHQGDSETSSVDQHVTS